MLPRTRENTRVSVKRICETIVSRTFTARSKYSRCDDGVKGNGRKETSGFRMKKIEKKCFDELKKEESGWYSRVGKNNQ